MKHCLFLEIEAVVNQVWVPGQRLAGFFEYTVHLSNSLLVLSFELRVKQIDYLLEAGIRDDTLQWLAA